MADFPTDPVERKSPRVDVMQTSLFNEDDEAAN
jgi:hypothetical protein